MPEDAGQARILVVDDDFRNTELLNTYLAKIGYDVVTASNGKQALEIVTDHPPDLILLDVMMPGLNGLEVCARLKGREETRLIPIVMVTALREVEDKIKAIEVGADDFLSKPFNIYELAARVKSLLRIKRLHDELEHKNALLYNVLSRYMSTEVSTQILRDPDRYLQLGGETRPVTVLFVDIKGFTQFAEQHSPTRVVKLLNTCFSELTEVIFKWRGTFDNFLGDAIMAFYGAPVSYEDDEWRALKTALELREAFWAWKERFQTEDLTSLGLAMGLHTGEAIVGNVGSELVMHYTVIGDTANVAKRLQELAEKEQILISAATYEAVADRAVVRALEPQVLRGRQEPIEVYELRDLPS
jgi:adenylate cyclase